MNINLKKSEKGFTIVELLIVIVVIAILATLVIVQFTNIQARARDTEKKSDMRAIQSKIAEYYAIQSKYPLLLSDATLALPVDACKSGTSTATCSTTPDYTYKAFLAATAAPLATNTAAAAATANATATDSAKYVLYVNNMEAQPAGTGNGQGTFWMVSSN
jgi:prepilin-type N-terminal cleavage/methylation domain-containing protein